jgi:hypothetical protein
MASLASQASVERDVARDRRTRSGPSFAWIGSAGGWLAGNIKYVAIAAIVLAGAAWVLSPRSDPHKAYHETYTGLYNEFKSLRSRKAGADEWDKFEGDVKMGVAPIVAKLEQEVERSSGKVKEGQTRLLEIGRDHLPDMLETARQKPSQAEKEFQEAMKEAVAAFNYFK